MCSSTPDAVFLASWVSHYEKIFGLFLGIVLKHAYTLGNKEHLELEV